MRRFRRILSILRTARTNSNVRPATLRQLTLATIATLSQKSIFIRRFRSVESSTWKFLVRNAENDKITIGNMQTLTCHGKGVSVP